VTRIHSLIEGQIAVRFDYKNLPDLDDLMLEIAREVDDERWGWMFEDDTPTRFAQSDEPLRWEWTKISPCWCGEHGWHWDSRKVPDDKDWLADRPKGRFLSIQWE
jgi:hypothetical protein